VSERGIADVSLRELAAALGTSHRMLIYHFGSKEGLFVEIVREAERQQLLAFADLFETSGGSRTDAARRFWQRITQPDLAPLERLFFEMYAQALNGRSHTARFLDGIVDSWIDPTVVLLRGEGLTEDEARAEARLGLAVVRGLLLDLLATGDLDGVNAAYERYLARQPGVG